jgi:DMSO reductase family type II enzyme heme b subunit
MMSQTFRTECKEDAMIAVRQNLLIIFVAVLALLGGGCRPAVEAPVPNVIVVPEDALPDHPMDAAWQNVPEHVAKLLLQDMVEPRLMTPSTSAVRVRSITDGARLALRLEWDDDSENAVAGTAEFPDACAIQLPARTEPTVPAPQMGEPGRPVEVTYWNAAWQATAGGRGNSMKDLHPTAAVDHYPFNAKSLEKDPAAQREMALRYAPAKALGNFMSGPRDLPVEDLVVEGPGTLRRAASLTSDGRGERTASGWAVVVSRPLPAGFSRGVPTQIAFAVWRGDQGEVGAKKMRTGWITLSIQEHP